MRRFHMSTLAELINRCIRVNERFNARDRKVLAELSRWAPSRLHAAAARVSGGD